MKSVKVTDIAKYAGVSTATVSRVMNGSAKVIPETREKVLRIIRDSGYRMDARNARRNIAIIFSGRRYGDSFYSYRMIGAMYHEIVKNGYHVELIAVEEINMLSERAICGAVSICGEDIVNSYWDDNFNIPLVRIGAPRGRFRNVSSVIIDARSCMHETVKYLVAEGHSNIAYVSNWPLESEINMPSKRYLSFLEAMNYENTGKPAPMCVFNPEPENEIKQLLEQGTTAILAVDFENGIKVHSILQKLGYAVPDDISLITWEVEHVSEFLNPPQTTFMLNHKRVASETIGLLQKMLTDKTLSRTVNIPMKLKKRKSVKKLNK